MPGGWDGAARAQAIDLTPIEPELVEHVVGVFAQPRGDARRHLGRWPDREWAVHRVPGSRAAVLDGDDDPVFQELPILQDLFRDLHDAVRQSRDIEEGLP